MRGSGAAAPEQPTQVVLVARRLTPRGLPRMLGLYEIGLPRKVGRYYQVPVITMREIGLRAFPAPIELKAASPKSAHALAIRHCRQLAEQMRLEVLITGPSA